MSDHPINLFYSEEDEGYVADISDLTHCSPSGATPAEALSQVLIAKAAWVDAALAKGKPSTEPKYRPAIHQVA